MRIAVSYDEGNVFEHVGDTEIFKIYEVENGTVEKTELCPVAGTGRQMVVDFVIGNHIDVLICGRVCGGAKEAVKEAGAEVFGCLDGDADEAVEAYIRGDLGDGGTSVCEHND